MDELNETWYTPDQVAERLQVSAFTVRRLLRDGDLRGVRIRGQWRIGEKDIEAFIEKHRRHEGAP
jgi:putative molybdopterin biosynthesis protein